MTDWDRYDRRCEFSELVGKTLTRAEKIDNGGDDEIIFDTDDGLRFTQYHSQDCCESVRVEDVVGDLSDLIGSTILQAEGVSHDGEADYENGDYDKKVMKGWPEGIPVPDYVSDSFTWTFYKLATIKGSVTIRWLGESNGYYSESVDFCKEPIPT